jgi:hypothetical protein
MQGDLRLSRNERNYVRVGMANAGSFDIILKQEGQPRPFYGYVGLEGECSLDILHG